MASTPTSLVGNVNLEPVFSFLRSLAGGAAGGEGLAESVRQKLLGVRDELCSRFGFAGDVCDAEWPTALVFALVASADFAEPPVVIHVVGAPGTAKTLGARAVSEYVKVPLLVLRFRGRDIVEVYRRLVAALARFLGVSEDVLVNRVGGVVRWLYASRGMLEVRLSLPHLASYALRCPSGLEALEGFVAEARATGFEVSIEIGRPRYEVVDPAQQGNLDDYRFRVQPSRLGILTISDIFDNYVLVLDEGCRNLNAVGYLLTKMSAVSLLEGLRVVVVTDNPDSLFSALSDERLAPLHDRAVRVFSSELRSPGDLLREPSVRLNALELLGGVERLFMELAKIYDQHFIASGEFCAQLYEASGRGLKWLIFRRDAGVGFTFTGRTPVEAVRKASRLYDEYLESYREMYGGRAGEQKGGARMVVAVDEEGRQLGEDNPAWNIAVTVNRAGKALGLALEQQSERG